MLKSNFNKNFNKIKGFAMQNNPKNMENKMGKIIYWTPRVLGIMFVLFLALFSLDVFEEGKSFGEIALGLLMHNIPALVLAGLLAAAWKREIIGAIAFILTGILYVGLIAKNALENGFEWYMVSWILTIAGPAFLVGILFWINWRKRQDNANLIALG